jgi:putative membrane protein
MWWWGAAPYGSAAWWVMPLQGILMLVLFALIVGGIAAVMFSLMGTPKTPRDATTSGIDILNERYAKGEIQRDEYLQKKRDLAA